MSKKVVPKKLKIVHVSSEVAPFSKTGGLGDVARSLPKALKRLGHDVILIYKEAYPSKWKEMIKKILLYIPFHNFKNIKTDNIINKLKLDRTKFHREFIEKEIFKISKTLYTRENLKHFVNEENFPD